ncbi:MAG: hypothetical protein AAFY30_09400 [Cyanobacteria bacterium J06642_12]
MAKRVQRTEMAAIVIAIPHRPRSLTEPDDPTYNQLTQTCFREEVIHNDLLSYRRL